MADTSVGGKNAAFTRAAFVMLGIALAGFLLVSLILDAAVNGLSLEAQRLIAFLTLIVPALTGALLAVIALARRERHWLLAALGLMLNGLWAAFFSLALAFAG